MTEATKTSLFKIFFYTLLVCGIYGLVYEINKRLKDQEIIVTQTATQNANARYEQDSIYYNDRQDSMTRVNDSLVTFLKNRPKGYEKTKIIYLAAPIDSNIIELWRTADGLKKRYGLE